MLLLKLNPIEPPWYGPVCPVVWEGRRREVSPYPDQHAIYGVYHHVSQQHLKRYLGEFDFRYNERIALGVNDTQRGAKAIKGAAGKRLTYRLPAGGAEQKQA
jgi:hypothetical protein